MFLLPEPSQKLWAIACCGSVICVLVAVQGTSELLALDEGDRAAEVDRRPFLKTAKSTLRTPRPPAEAPPPPPRTAPTLQPAAKPPTPARLDMAPNMAAAPPSGASSPGYIPNGQLELTAADGLAINAPASDKRPTNLHLSASKPLTSLTSPDSPTAASQTSSFVNPTLDKSFVVQASGEQELAPAPPPASALDGIAQPDRLPSAQSPTKPLPHMAPTRVTKDHGRALPEFDLNSPPRSITRVRLGDQPSSHSSLAASSNSGTQGAEELPASSNRPLELIQFDDVSLAEAMKLFSEQSGLNVITSTEAGKTKVNVFLRNVSPLDALDAIVKANGLFYRVESGSGIVRIATSREYEKDLSSFREEQTQVFTLLYPNPIAVAQVIQQVFGNRVQMNRADADIDDLVDLSRRFNRFDMVDGRSLGLGSPNNNASNNMGGNNALAAGNRGGLGNALGGNLGGLGVGGLGVGGLGVGGLGVGGAMAGFNGAGGVAGLPGLNGNYPVPSSMQHGMRARDNQLLNNLSSAEIQQLENQIASDGGLDEQSQAELMQRRDATIYISTIRRNNQIIVRTGDNRSMEQIAQLIKQLDVPTPTVLLEVKVLRVLLANGFNSAFEYFGGSGNAAGALSDGSLTPAFPGASTVARNLGAGLGVAGGVPGSLTFQMVDDKFKVRMQLLESKNCVTALATPLILTANNEVSRIFVGDTLPFTVGFTPSQVLSSVSAVNGAVAATPITELRDVGQSLLITPNINADRTVTLRVIEENSERVVAGSSIPVPATSGTGVTNVNVDTVRRRTISGTIVAQDGMAVALGGLIEEQVSDARDQVPVLGNVPGLGILFRRQHTGRSRSELVVIVRPYVFNTPTESAATSEMLLGELSTHPDSADAAGASSGLPCRITRSEDESSQRARLFQLHHRSLTAY